MRQTIVEDDDIDDEPDEELETAWLAYWTSRPGTPQARIALDNYKRLSERRPLPPPRVPVCDSMMARCTYRDPPLMFMRWLRKPWRLEINPSPDRSIFVYFATEAEARRTAKRFGVDV